MKGRIALIVLGAIFALATMFYNGQKEATSTITFEEYKLTYGLSYAGEAEEAYRRRIFEENVRKIEEHNSRNDQTYEMGINQFTHLTQ